MAKAPATKTTEPKAGAGTPTEEAPSTALAPLSDASSWLAKDDEKFQGTGAGTEDIGVDDVRFPRLAIAQGLSPQIAGETPVEGLKLYDLFNDLTNEVYGRGPIFFVPCRRDVRYIEFKPREEGGGVLDLNVPANDPRTEWTTDVKDGEKVRHAPRATKFVEFVILLLRENKTPEPIVLSIKDTNKWNRAAHTSLTTFIKLRNDDIYGGIYKISSHPERNDSGIFGVYKVDNAGRASAMVRELGRKMYDSLQGKTILVDRDNTSEADEVVKDSEGQPVPF